MQYIPLRGSSMFVASCQYDFWRLTILIMIPHLTENPQNFENAGYPTDRYFSRRNNCGAYFALEPPQYLPSIEIGRDKHHSLGGRIFGSNADGHSWKSRMQAKGGGHFCFMPAFFRPMFLHHRTWKIFCVCPPVSTVDYLRHKNLVLFVKQHDFCLVLWFQNTRSCPLVDWEANACLPYDFQVSLQECPNLAR